VIGPGGYRSGVGDHRRPGGLRRRRVPGHLVQGGGRRPRHVPRAVIALDAATGRLLWKTYTVPSNNGGGDSNLPGYYSGNAVWSSSPVVDPRRGLVYVGTGNNYTVPDGVCVAPGQTGCTRPAADDYVDSILALNLRDGTVAWADHTLNADLWTLPQPSGPDFDFGAGPNLFTTKNPVTGRPEQLLGIGQKSGVYAFGLR